MKRLSTLFVLLFAIVLIVSINTACDSSKKTPEPQQQQQATGPIIQDVKSDISGKVVETINSGGYTYLKLEKNGNEIWLAVSETDIKAGEEMTFYAGDVMYNFTSKTLGRTFDSIMFSPGPVGQAGDPYYSSFVSKGAITPEVQKVEVEKAVGADAYTIAELYEKSAELDTKTVTVKGVVIKVSIGIMGKNWVHIQDGSGDSAAGNHDLVVTTDAVPLKDEIITVNGTLNKDKDFGAGYSYAVIVEDAEVSK